MLRITASGASEITVTSRNVEVKTADTTIKYSIPIRRKKPKVATHVTVNAQNTIVNVKRIRPKVKLEPELEVEPEVEELRTVYSPEEVKLMNDLELEEKFVKLTGIRELQCSECSPSSKSISTSWMYSIRKRCLKVGLHKDIKIPKTCDRQSKRNDERNYITNKYNGQLKKYYKNRDKFTIEDIKKWEEERVSELKKIGVKSRPSKHVL